MSVQDPPLLYVVLVGKPQPQGSIQPFVHWKERKGKNKWKWVPARRPDGSIIVSVTSDNDNLKAWRNELGHAARQYLVTQRRHRQVGPFPLVGVGFTVEMVSHFKRREADWGTGKNAHLLKPGVEAYPIREPRGGGAPDVDKLLRAALDALSGVVWADDSQVTDSVSRKRFAVPGPEGDGIRAELAVWPNLEQLGEDLPAAERTRTPPAKAPPDGALSLL